jgi:hypothetical protein
MYHKKKYDTAAENLSEIRGKDTGGERGTKLISWGNDYV